MGPFELNDTSTQAELNNEEINESSENSRVSNCSDSSLDPRRIREENIIALKVYDSCRHLNFNNIQRILSSLM